VVLVWTAVAAVLIVTAVSLATGADDLWKLSMLLLAAGLNAAGPVVFRDESAFLTWLAIVSSAVCLGQALHVGLAVFGRRDV
jgi:hypothetical protein